MPGPQALIITIPLDILCYILDVSLAGFKDVQASRREICPTNGAATGLKAALVCRRWKDPACC